VKSALRAFLLVLLVVSALVRVQTIRDREDMIARHDSRQAVTALLTRSGLQVNENPLRPPKILSWIVYFHRPGCGQTSLAMPFRMNLEALPIVGRVAAEGYKYRFYYLDGSWPTQDHLVMFRLWLTHAVLSVIAASPYIPVHTALVTADPVACDVRETVDWKLVWNREHQRSAIDETHAGRAPQDLIAGRAP
jgi:hypothetical protein